MKTRSWRFLIGSLLVLTAFVALNALVAHLRSTCGLLGLFGIAGCNDDIRRAGFPFEFYEEGGFGYHRIFILRYLVYDIVVGLTLAMIGGLLAARARGRWSATASGENPRPAPLPSAPRD